MAAPNERQHRVVHNIKTGETTIEQWSSEEWAKFEEQTRIENEENARPKEPTLEERVTALEQQLRTKE